VNAINLNSSINFSNNNGIDSLTSDNVGGTSASKGDTTVKQNLESSIKNLREKVDKKCNLKWESGNRRNCIRNKVANVFFRGRKEVLNDIKSKLDMVFDENCNLKQYTCSTDFHIENLNGIKHSSVAKDAENLKRVLFVAQSQGTLRDKINFINECRNLVSEIYFVLEACLKAGNLKDEGNCCEMSLVSYNGTIDDIRCSLDELLKYRNGFESSNVKICEKYKYKGEEKDTKGILKIFSTINTNLSQRGLPAFEIKGNKIKNFDKWFNNCVDQLNNLIGENNEKSSDVSNEQNVLSQDKVQELWNKIGTQSSVGAGTYGEVYKVTDGGKTYAFKKIKTITEDIKKEKSANEALAKNLKSFEKEKDVFYKQSSGLLTGYMGQYEIAIDGKNEQFFVQEFCEGKNLQNVLVSKTEGDEVFSSQLNSNGKLCLNVAVQMGHAVAELHAAGIVNRDIKPGNTMINIVDGENEQKEVSVKLIDLGTACFLGDKQVNSENKRSFEFNEGERCVNGIGSPNYMAPEVLDKKDNILGQPAVDVFSYGISVLEVLLGGSLYEKSAYKFPWKISEFVTNNDYKQLLTATNDDPFQNFFGKLYSKQNNIANEKTQAIKEKVPGERRQKFLASILADCLAKDPKKRISVAQAAELMQILASSLEKGANENDLMSYEGAKAMVLKDRPKEVPPGIMDKLFSGNYQDYLDGMNAFQYLESGDSIDENSVSMGLVKLCFWPKDKFDAWKTKAKDSGACERMIENLLIDGRFDQLPEDKRKILEATEEYGEALCLAVERAPYYDDENGTLGENLVEKLASYIGTNNRKADILSQLDKSLSERINVRLKLDKDGEKKQTSKLLAHVENLGELIPDFKESKTYKLKQNLFNDKPKVEDNASLAKEDVNLAQKSMDEEDVQKESDVTEDVSYGVDVPTVERSYDTDE